MSSYTTSLSWAIRHATLTIPTIGIITAVLTTLLIRAARRSHLDRAAVTVAVALASGFSAQGMWEVATQRLHLPTALAGGLFVVAEAAMLASAVRAHRLWQQHGTLGIHGRFVFTIATVAGVVVSLNAHSPSEYILRLSMPLLVAWLWRLGYDTERHREHTTDAVTWRWTPRRIGIALHLMEPGQHGVIAIDRERRIRTLTTHADALHHGAGLLRSFHRARLRQLALLADDDMVTEVQQRINRVHHIEATTAPANARPPSAASAPERAMRTPPAVLANTPPPPSQAALASTRRSQAALASTPEPPGQPAIANTPEQPSPSPSTPTKQRVVTRPYSELLAEAQTLLEHDHAVSMRTVQRHLNVGTARARRLLADARLADRHH